MNREPLHMTKNVILTETVTLGRGKKRCVIPAGTYRLGCMGRPTLEFLPDHELYGKRLGWGIEWNELNKLHESGTLINA